MEKTEAIKLLGGTVTSAASAIGISPQAVSTWPDVLPQRITDRVQAALWRMARGAAFPAAIGEALADIVTPVASRERRGIAPHETHRADELTPFGMGVDRREHGDAELAVERTEGSG